MNSFQCVSQRTFKRREDSLLDSADVQTEVVGVFFQMVLLCLVRVTQAQPGKTVPCVSKRVTYSEAEKGKNWVRISFTTLYCIKKPPAKMYFSSEKP